VYIRQECTPRVGLHRSPILHMKTIVFIKLPYYQEGFTLPVVNSPDKNYIGHTKYMTILEADTQEVL